MQLFHHVDQGVPILLDQADRTTALISVTDGGGGCGLWRFYRFVS